MAFPHYSRAADMAPPVGRLDTTERRVRRVKAPALAEATSAATADFKRAGRVGEFGRVFLTFVDL